jgi:hypothetical protein
MNRFRQLCAAILLTAVLVSSTALAGNMPCGVTSPTPTTEASATGDMPNGATSSSDASLTGDMPLGDTSDIDPVTGLALDMLRSLLSLF